MVDMGNYTKISNVLLLFINMVDPFGPLPTERIEKGLEIAMPWYVLGYE
jgi:hypothetical protein